MCGIAGVLGAGDADALVRRMSDALRHRGPDDAGVASLPGGGAAGAFGHRRLSILDLSPAGHQPMSTADGRYTLAYNGEIYNFRELRAELERAGESFRSTSDTEVLLLGWARHGPAFLGRLRGMFAFAVWDREEGCAHLARDPFGIKPLFVYASGGEVLFASEVRALLASGRVPRRLSREAVRTFLSTGSVEEPLTIVEGVRAVPAGTYLRVSVGAGGAVPGAPASYAGAPLVSPPPELLRDPVEAAARVRETLRGSVACHLVSDVPVAFFLSGGIDSSALVGLAAEVGAPLDTFTVTFAEEGFSEAGPARAVAERFGARHHEIPLSGAELLEALPEAFGAMDQPSLDGLNTYVVSRAVRSRGIRVVLSGLGGDELFAGYPSFGRARRVAPLWKLPGGVRRLGEAGAARLAGVRGEKLELLLGAPSPSTAAYRASRALFGDRRVKALAGGAGASHAPPPPPGLSLLQQVSWHELTGYMRNTLLRDSDVFSMAHGLELRVPFVDREVAAAAAAVDDRLKLAGGVSKPVLVRALEDLLPREVWDRPKQGFTLPFERWLRGPLGPEVSAMLAGEGARGVGLAPGAVRRVWRDFLDGRPGMSWSRPWALYTLVRWAEANDVTLSPPVESSSPGRGARLGVG